MPRTLQQEVNLAKRGCWMNSEKTNTKPKCLSTLGVQAVVGSFVYHV